MLKKRIVSVLIVLCLLLSSVLPSALADSEALIDSYQVDIYAPATAIVMAPTVISDGMTAFTDKRPATVCLPVTLEGDTLYTLDAAGAPATLDSQLLLIKGLAMPMLSIQDAQSAEALRAYLNEQQLSNAFVTAGDAVLVKTICQNNMYLRPVLDLSDRADLSIASVCNAVYENGMNIVIIGEAFATPENIYQLQQRYLTVFVRTSGDPLSLHTQILSGANGIITENWPGAIDALEGYTETTVVRPTHVIGHRGNNEAAPDNTLRSIVSAIEVGADIVEIDVRMTKDGQLILCHDKIAPLVGRTQYTVSETELSVLTSMELADARAESTDRLITLEDAFILIKESYPHIVLELDLKDRRMDVVEAIHELAVKYDMLANIALLSSNLSLNAKAIALPLGCAVLNCDSKSGAVRAGNAAQSAYLAESSYRLTGGYLCQEYLYFSVNLIENAKHQGMTSWIYTMNTARDMDNRFLQGFAGITTNLPSHGANWARYLKTETVDGVQKASLHMYDGTVRDVTEDCEEVTLAEGVKALRCKLTLTNKKTYAIYSLPFAE